MTNIAIIGSGKLATSLAIALHKTEGVRLTQVYSRTIENARALAERVDAGYTDNLCELSKADFYITAVTDTAQEVVWKGLKESRSIGQDSIVCHTSGSLGLEEIRRYFSNSAVFYPLQSFTKGRDIDFSDVPMLIESSNSETNERIKRLAGKLSKRVFEINSDDRKTIHLGAVFASNFSNSMYAVADQIMREGGLDFSILSALIRETTEKALSMPPVEAQSGPAVRGDRKVMDMQMMRLKPEFKEVYRVVSENIERMRDERVIND